MTELNTVVNIITMADNPSESWLVFIMTTYFQQSRLLFNTENYFVHVWLLHSGRLSYKCQKDSLCYGCLFSPWLTILIIAEYLINSRKTIFIMACWLFLPWLTILIMAYFFLNGRRKIFIIACSFHHGWLSSSRLAIFLQAERHDSSWLFSPWLTFFIMAD